MTKTELTKAIKAAKYVYINCIYSADDCHYVRAYKNDVLAMLKNWEADEFHASLNNAGDVYIG